MRENSLMASMIAAFAMYSRIPMPAISWEKERVRWQMCFFPLVGAVIGAAFWLLAWALRRVSAGPLLSCVLSALLPVVLTGGIHLDGFLDTVDARQSWKGREERVKILKDPHSGAFAIIHAGMVFLLYPALLSELLRRESRQGLAAVALGFVLSRALSGLAVVAFPTARRDGMAAASARAADPVRRRVCGVLSVWIAAAVLLQVLLGGLCGVVAVLSAALVFAGYHHMAVSEFGGVSGDLAGYFLVRCELAMAAAAVAGAVLT